MSMESASRTGPAPLVSVLITTYQHAAYIGQCLDSVLAQRTDFPVEVLVGEDESTDGTREICQDYARRFPDRIQLVLNSRKDVMIVDGRPTGRANAWKLFRAARGQFIARCEGDDLWADPFKLQKQVDRMRAEPDIVLCCTRAMLLKGVEQEPHAVPDDVDLDDIRGVDLLRTWNFITTASIMFHRRLLPLPEWLLKLPFVDLGLYVHAAHQGRVVMLREPMTVYRITAQGIWSGSSKSDQRRRSLRFYRTIRPQLNGAEREQVARRIAELYAQEAAERFPHSPRRQRAYGFWLHLMGHRVMRTG